MAEHYETGKIFKIAQVVLKRSAEMDIENTNHEGILLPLPARKLESEGIMRLLPFFEEVSNEKIIELSMDHDASTEKTIREAGEGFKYKIIIKPDAAHSAKNMTRHINKKLEALGHSNDGDGGIGNNNKRRLIESMTYTVTALACDRKKNQISKQEIKDRLYECSQHCLGNHDYCRHKDLCGEEPILKTYKNFNQKKLDELTELLFNDWFLADAMVNDIYNAGSTSKLESHHAQFLHRK